MIYDNIRNRERYRDNTPLYKVLEFLASVGGHNFPQHKTELDGDRIFVNPVSLNSKPQADCIYEAHRKYSDVHFIVEGTEGIAVADVDTLSEDTPYDESKDIAFYKGGADNIIYLKPGDFMLCEPRDAHMVAVMKDAPAPIRKLVGKIQAAPGSL